MSLEELDADPAEDPDWQEQRAEDIEEEGYDWAVSDSDNDSLNGFVCHDDEVEYLSAPEEEGSASEGTDSDASDVDEA